MAMAVRVGSSRVRLGAALCLVVACLTLTASTASAVRFDMQSGTVEVFLREVGGSPLAGIGPFDLNGVDDFADFNADPVAMTDTPSPVFTDVSKAFVS